MACQPAVTPAPREDRRDWVDLHVAHRLKAKRILENMSQERLARALGISYQQLQRYEAGKGRLTCSLVYRAAKALNVPVTYFFEQMPEGPSAVSDRQPDKATLSAVRNLQGIANPDTRDCLVRLIDVLGKPMHQDKSAGA